MAHTEQPQRAAARRHELRVATVKGDRLGRQLQRPGGRQRLPLPRL